MLILPVESSAWNVHYYDLSKKVNQWNGVWRGGRMDELISRWIDEWSMNGSTAG